MYSTKKSGAIIRQDYINFFEDHGHTFVPSSSLVPGGDQTLLFTNAGMVQFKEVFLGTDMRPYVRAVNSQKCMRVAGKHNDLEDVGRDDTHHTFFEMLGNWSFGDYYKKEAIAWAWELLTEVWSLPKENIWATCFKDEYGEIPQDDEAVDEWIKQPGIDPSHILFFGRKDNFWEMAETGPCGPCSEIHLDRGQQYCDMKNVPDHECKVNGDCTRFLELWNLVFIQYNRTSPSDLEPLPAKHVDTGMGFERIVSVLQDVDSNYKTDLFTPLMNKIQSLAGHDTEERNSNLTPYRVIADHSRAATFLIADGVVPGNIGRNYVCRMIIRRAARFGSKIGFDMPFLSQIAEVVVGEYGGFYPELEVNKETIFDNITREEIRFQRTVESGIAKLESLLDDLRSEDIELMPGEVAFNLYATYGLPLEIIQDIARERNMGVEQDGFRDALEKHRLASGAGETMGPLGGENVDIYRNLFVELKKQKKLEGEGVQYNPYDQLEITGEVLAIIQQGTSLETARLGDKVEVIIPETPFYIASGGQVSDTGWILSDPESTWEIQIADVRKPSSGIIVHEGKVTRGELKVGDPCRARVNRRRRLDIMRNHTATHLLHAELRKVLGRHARQAGSLVAPDRLRFDFTHSSALTDDQIDAVEKGVNEAILGDYRLNIDHKPLQQAIDEGATALFGEKYGEIVRNITIGEPDVFSNELCGGTHVEKTGDVGLFQITSEGSVAAGIRRIEAVTGRSSFKLAKQKFNALKRSAALLGTTPLKVPEKVQNTVAEGEAYKKKLEDIQRQAAALTFVQHLDRVPTVNGIPVLTAVLADCDMETLRFLSDKFRERNPSGVAVIASVNSDGKPIIVSTVTDDLVQKGLHAGELVKLVAAPLGGSGGGRPTFAQAGGKDAKKLEEALANVEDWVRQSLNQEEV
jgi:alanyl-tRNA synthetase